MIRVRWFVLVAIVASMLACQTTSVISSYLSPAPTATRTRSPTRPVATFTPQQAAQPTLPPPPPAPPTTPPELTGTVTENSRVRATPSTGGAIVARLNKGDQIKAVGRNAASDWYQIQLPSDANSRGWISAELVQLQGSADSLPIVQSGSAPPPAPPPPGPPAPPTPTQRPYP